MWKYLPTSKANHIVNCCTYVSLLRKFLCSVKLSRINIENPHLTWLYYSFSWVIPYLISYITFNQKTWKVYLAGIIKYFKCCIYSLKGYKYGYKIIFIALVRNWPPSFAASSKTKQWLVNDVTWSCPHEQLLVKTEDDKNLVDPVSDALLVELC